MVRTKADSGARKAVAAKAPRKALGGGSAASSSGSSSSLSSPSANKNGKYGGGNSVVQRPTPDWQKGIDGFFQKGNKENTESTELDDSLKNKELSVTQNSTDSDREPEAAAAASSSSSSRKIARISSDEEDDD